MRQVVGRAKETSTYSWSRFCTVNCRLTASNYQVSHLRPCWEPNPGRRECYHFAIVAPDQEMDSDEEKIVTICSSSGQHGTIGTGLFI